MTQEISSSPIVKVARCMFPGEAGPRFVVMGYSAEGKELFGLGCHPADGYAWMLASVSAADRRRVRREYAAWLKETGEETGNAGTETV